MSDMCTACRADDPRHQDHDAVQAEEDHGPRAAHITCVAIPSSTPDEEGEYDTNAEDRPDPRRAQKSDQTRNDRHGQQRSAEDDEHNPLTSLSNHRTHYRRSDVIREL